MPVALLDIPEPMTPSDADVRLAKESSRRLSPFAKRDRPMRFAPQGDGAEPPVELPASAVRLLVQLLTDMAAGHAVMLIPVHAELTTQQAADLLGVSRPFIIKQIEENKLPHRRIGTHRRVMFKDLMDYKHRMDADRRKALDELSSEAQKLNLGY